MPLNKFTQPTKYMLGYKYTKRNVPIMIPRLIRVYCAHASQTVVRDIVIGFHRSV